MESLWNKTHTMQNQLPRPTTFGDSNSSLAVLWLVLTLLVIKLVEAATLVGHHCHSKWFTVTASTDITEEVMR